MLLSTWVDSPDINKGYSEVCGISRHTKLKIWLMVTSATLAGCAVFQWSYSVLGAAEVVFVLAWCGNRYAANTLSLHVQVANDGIHMRLDGYPARIVPYKLIGEIRIINKGIKTGLQIEENQQNGANKTIWIPTRYPEVMGRMIQFRCQKNKGATK